MFRRLLELVLPRIIGVMVHKRETLTSKDQGMRDAFLAKLGPIKKRETKEPIIVAVIGLVGSGKSSVAQELAQHIGAMVIEGDAIRVELRRNGEGYEKTRIITENIAVKITKWCGGNVVLDSDFVDEHKRASIREKARKEGIRLVFIRTHCDFDVMAGRMLTATYHNTEGDFFGGASSEWRGNNKGAVVKLREMWRRTPHHYRWVNKGGGKWVPRKFPFPIFAEIDTTDQDSWRRDVGRCARKLLN